MGSVLLEDRNTIVKQYIKDFENLGFGMFVHFGLYSILGTAEWAKRAGGKYITLTIRHHDAFFVL